MAFVEPEYQGVKEKREKKRGDSKGKKTMKIPFIVPSPPPAPTLILLLRLPSLWTFPLLNVN